MKCIIRNNERLYGLAHEDAVYEELCEKSVVWERDVECVFQRSQSVGRVVEERERERERLTNLKSENTEKTPAQESGDQLKKE